MSGCTVLWTGSMGWTLTEGTFRAFFGLNSTAAKQEDYNSGYLLIHTLFWHTSTEYKSRHEMLLKSELYTT